MASQTFLTRDIVGQYWGVLLISYMSSSEFKSYPFARGFEEFVEKKRTSNDALVKVLAKDFGLDIGLVQSGINGYPWNECVWDVPDAQAEIALMTGRWPDESEIKSGISDQLIIEAMEGALPRLLDALIAAVFSFKNDEDIDVISVIKSFLTTLANIVTAGEGVVFESLVRGFEYWCQESLKSTIEHPNTMPEYRDWLVNKVKL